MNIFNFVEYDIFISERAFLMLTMICFTISILASIFFLINLFSGRVYLETLILSLIFIFCHTASVTKGMKGCNNFREISRTYIKMHSALRLAGLSLSSITKGFTISKYQ